ncbi:MAG: glycosyltransferase family 4 protein, partial [Pyrinomonas methylaliphatogenes]|nr:glycosyltransferase family 4 protein [Pyrinomonas methylaliphatogenes]
IFLNSPNVDNMPNSIIEAFAAGTPVVTTDAGGIPYIVTHERTGLLVPKNDHEKLAASAIRLIEDQELASRIIANARDECRKYVWENVRHDWLNLYERLAGYGEVLRKSKGMESEEVASFQER